MIFLWSPDILTALRWELHPGRFQTEWWPEGKSMWRSKNKRLKQFVLTSKLSVAVHLDRKYLWQVNVLLASIRCFNALTPFTLPENKHIWLWHSKFSREVKMTFRQAGYQCFFKAGPQCLSETMTEDSNRTLSLLKIIPCGLSQCHSPNVQHGDINQRKQAVMFHQAVRAQEITTISCMTLADLLFETAIN